MYYSPNQHLTPVVAAKALGAKVVFEALSHLLFLLFSSVGASQTQAHEVLSLLTISLLSSFSPGLTVQLWSSQNLPLHLRHSLVLCQGNCFLLAAFSPISDLS